MEMEMEKKRWAWERIRFPGVLQFWAETEFEGR